MHPRTRLRRRLSRATVAALVVVLMVIGPGRVVVVEAQAVGEVSGRVTTPSGAPVAGVRVGILALGSGAAGGFFTTNANGQYSILDVPQSAGPYDVQLIAPCTRDQSKRVIVDGVETVDFTIAAQDKRAGYTCAATMSPYIDVQNSANIADEDEEVAVEPFSAGWTFPFFGEQYEELVISTNGWVSPRHPGDPVPGAAPLNNVMPHTDGPNGVIAPLWDDLIMDAAAGFEPVRRDFGGTAPNRYLAIEWEDAFLKNTDDDRVSFEVLLFENGRIVFNYADISAQTTNQRERGTSATVGIENADETAAVQRSYNQPYLDNGYAIEFVPAPK